MVIGGADVVVGGGDVPRRGNRAGTVLGEGPVQAHVSGRSNG